MPKFNKPSKETGSNKTTNFEDAPAFTMDQRTELYTRVLTTLMSEPKFYESGKDSDDKLIALTRQVAQGDPKFVAGLAILARKKFHLRSVPQVLVVELAQVHRGDSLVSHTIQNTVERPDDMTEMLAYFGNAYGSKPKPLAKLPKQIKLGLASVFPRFDAYQLAKYNRDSAVKLRDVLFLCHAHPQDSEQEKIWKQLIDGTLQPPETWEVELSKGGDKKRSWEKIIPKMGYMALLRNLRNFIQAGVDPKHYVTVLTDEEGIEKSKQFPFRFMSAYRELEKAGAPTIVMDCVAIAMEIAVQNVPVLDGVTLVASDNSASMTSPLSKRGSVSYMDVANLMGAIVHKKYPNSMAGVFGEDWALVGLSKMNSVLANKDKLDHTDVGHSTNTWKVFRWLGMKKKQVDRIIVFSDMQAWDSTFYSDKDVQSEYQNYKRVTGNNPIIYSIDLAGYGTSDLDPRNPKLHKLAGWSEKIFAYIKACEEDPKSVFAEIYELTG